MKITRARLQKIIREEEQKLIVEAKTRKTVRHVLSEKGMMDKIKGFFGKGKKGKKK